MTPFFIFLCYLAYSKYLLRTIAFLKVILTSIYAKNYIFILLANN